MSHWRQIAFQDAATPIITILIAFHDHAILVIIIVLTFVSYAILSLLINKYTSRNVTEAQSIETIWTILPAFILLFLALPSLQLLYLTDEIVEPGVTLKAIGHQWYWSYEYTDFCNIEFDSYIVNTNDLREGQFRLLEVDNRVVLPINVEVRVLVSAADVIHSWTVPALGVKADAIPGRLNQLSFVIRRPGIFYGQCSEICGANHRFIPIAVESVNTNRFINWINSFKDINN